MTLIYLAVQVRQSTRAVKAANNQAQTDGHCAYLTAAFSDPVLCKIFNRILRSETLDADERERLPPLLHCVFTQFENGYRCHREGLIDLAWWEKQASTLGGWLQSSHVQDWWEREGRVYPSDFRGYIDARLGPPEAPGS